MNGIDNIRVKKQCTARKTDNRQGGSAPGIVRFKKLFIPSLYISGTVLLIFIFIGQ